MVEGRRPGKIGTIDGGGDGGQEGSEVGGHDVFRALSLLARRSRSACSRTRELRVRSC